MGKRDKSLPDLKVMVEGILEKDAHTREDNDYLFVKVIQLTAPDLLDVPMLIGLQSDRLPSYESVTRLRRMVVKERPELDSEEKVRKRRAEMETDYREFVHHG